jgi:hypothetical protein
LVHNAKQVPLTDQVRVDKEEIYDLLDQMRATIPEEIKQARWIVKERQEMLAEAKREAERIVKEARERQEHLISHEEVTKAAERAAEDIVEEAQAREREIRLGAEDYADEILNTLEINLSKFIAAVQRGRALRRLGDLLVGDQVLLALARLLDDPLGLALGLREHLLALLDDPASLLDLLRDRRAHLVEQIVDLLLVHAHLIGERDLLGVVHQVVKLVDEYENVHGYRVTRAPNGALSSRLSRSAQLFLQTRGDVRVNETLDPPAKGCEFLDAAGGDEAELWARHDVHGLDFRRLAAVELVHLEFVLEVGDRAKALHDRARADPPGELDDQRVEGLGAHPVQVGSRRRDELQALGQLEQRRCRFTHGVGDDGDDHLVKQRARACDYVHVPVGDRIVGAGTYSDAMAVAQGLLVSWMRMIVSP